MGKQVVRSPYIVNSATGVTTEDKRETKDEKKYYRVMPIDLTGNGVEKLYFDSRDQYLEWRRKELKNEPYKSLGIYTLNGYDISQKYC